MIKNKPNMYNCVDYMTFCTQFSIWKTAIIRAINHVFIHNSKILLLIFSLIILVNLINLSAADSAYGPIIKTDSYEISRSYVIRDISVGDMFKDSFIIKNLKDKQIKVSLAPSEEISKVISLESSGELIDPNNYTSVFFTISGIEAKIYSGNIEISGDIKDVIPINITVVNESLTPKLLVEISSNKKEFTFNDKLDFKIDIKKVIGDEPLSNVTFSYYLNNPLDNRSYFLGNETKDLLGSFQIRKNIYFPEKLTPGSYIVEVITTYKDKTMSSSDGFLLKTPFWSIKFLGFIPLWLLAILLSILITLIFFFTIVKKTIEKRKKYKMQLYTKTLPQKTDTALFLGKVAETNIPAYLEADALTTHGVVAGATGGGKSIAAQVIIEEALLKNIAVIVFDPTAQWSGMLRKCDDKRMLSFYPKFGLKPSDAKAFSGNVRQIMNERQAIDIKKYMAPGQIQIFTMNKLTPPQIDTFVASVIASIFKSDPKEFPNLRVLLVFDEVHRLLPKFGGSGKGFLQIERACREFRKWGFGVMLVSQVLSDFVGEIKANINTEVQMRTRDEADLNRIKTKYGEEFLQSLIKASVGVGMFVNAKYNRGKPYFVHFRPILHNTRRLSDEILEQYNKYGEIIDDLEYQIEQLEQEKIDVFDLKMELKLVKDKLMTGNFTVVDIYLEGLKPRIEKHWQTLNKKPKKRELELIDTNVIESSIKQAQKSRAEFDEKLQKNKVDETPQENKIQDSNEKEEKIDEIETSRFAFAQSPYFNSRVSKSNLDGAQEPEHAPEFIPRVLDKTQKKISRAKIRKLTIKTKNRKK